MGWGSELCEAGSWVGGCDFGFDGEFVVEVDLDEMFAWFRFLRRLELGM